MSIIWDKNEVPKPGNSYIGKSDGRVYILSSQELPFDKCKRIVIGHSTGGDLMYPNKNYRYIFPKLWEKYYGNKVKHHVLYSGMYALTLGIGYLTNLYPLLVDAIGAEATNFLMDYSMFSIQNKSDVSMDFHSKMERQIVFSRKCQNDTWISDFFKNSITDDQTMDFREKWVERCAKNGVKKVWISIDGSNNNCNATKCSIAQKGNAKSGKNVPIVGYMYAVDAEDGSPITYTEYEGNMVDSKAFMKLIELLIILRN